MPVLPGSLGFGYSRRTTSAKSSTCCDSERGRLTFGCERLLRLGLTENDPFGSHERNLSPDSADDSTGTISKSIRSSQRLVQVLSNFESRASMTWKHRMPRESTQLA